MEDDRPGWDEYFMSIAAVVSTRSTCLRRKVGAVIVRDRQIISTGYNGAPRELPIARDGLLRERMGVPPGATGVCRGSRPKVRFAQAGWVGARPGRVLTAPYEMLPFLQKIPARRRRIVFANPYL